MNGGEHWKVDNARPEGQYGRDFEIKERVALCGRSLSANCFPQRVAKIALEKSKFLLSFRFRIASNVISHRSNVDLIMRITYVK